MQISFKKRFINEYINLPQHQGKLVDQAIDHFRTNPVHPPSLTIRCTAS